MLEAVLKKTRPSRREYPELSLKTSIERSAPSRRGSEIRNGFKIAGSLGSGSRVPNKPPIYRSQTPGSESPEPTREPSAWNMIHGAARERR